MKKEEQIKVNERCVNVFMKAVKEETICEAQLRSCKALVYETEHYYILKSYRTIVAIIDKETDEMYDILRMVYGYTATSAQHIAKFGNDYLKSWRSKSNTFVARNVE